ncbi:MAG: EAL domain-containing protein [Nitrospirae bacterium]|nr:EAL domain-containing protein [Nitrospirota bacterium]
MRQKIILYLFAIFLFITSGAVLATIYISNTISSLSRIIELHQIEDRRNELVYQVQTVQSDLYSLHTPVNRDLDSIVSNMSRLEETADNCTSCHHSALLTDRLIKVQSLVNAYKTALSYVVTFSGKQDRLVRLKLESIQIGDSILSMTGDMSSAAGKRLHDMTLSAMKEMEEAEKTLAITLIITLIMGVLAAVNLMNSVTRPVDELVKATRIIASGDFGYNIPLKEKAEFGELARNFNIMSNNIRDFYEKIRREIAERRHTEESLANSEKFLNIMFDSIRDPFCIVDRNFTIVRANNAYAELKGKSTNEMVGRKCHEIFYNRHNVCSNCIVETTFKSTDTCATEKMLNVAGGQRMWAESYTYPIFDELGNVSHVIEYTRDITDRKNIENALRESKERYELSARGANDGLWDWNLKTNEVYYSLRWKAMLGFEEKHIMNNPDEWFSRVHPGDRSPLENALSAHMNGMTAQFESEHRMLNKDGVYIWVLSRGVAVRDSAGKAYRIAGSQTDITGRKVSEEQLQYKALHDLLTDLPNRLLFLDRMQLFLDRSRRYRNYTFGVLFLDVDRFKNINDSLGHIVGDKLLISIARRLKVCVRPGDTVARLGGDEFAILCDDVSSTNDVKGLAERIHEEMSVPFTVMGHEVFASTSIGIAISNSDYTQPEQLLRDADTAMYHAKSLGKACHVMFDKSMHDRAVALLQMETDLRRAIERSEFSIYYQPILEVETKKIAGFEALLRWNHPVRGLLMPNEFIRLSEETGLIIPMTRWVLNEACRQVQQWNRQYHSVPPLTVSVNISGVHFRNNLLMEIEKALEETDFDAHNLILEVTESMLMDNAESAAVLLTQLRAMDVKLQIDDFGTGYSSLSYLHHFPIDALKIDRSFIRMMVVDKGNIEIVRTIITLAHNLGIEVIAEGVENEEQLRLLSEMKCKYVQGFLFSKPLDSKEIENLLKKSLLTV